MLPSNKKTVRFSNKMQMLVLFDDDSISSTSDDTLHDADNRCCCPPRRCKKDMWDQVRGESLYLKRKGIGILMKDSFYGSAHVAQENINAFVQLPPASCGRGLEKYLSRQHEEERLFAREAAKAAVLTGQKSMKQQGYTPAQISLKLADTHRESSLTAKVFARRLGIADEIACRYDEDLEAAQNLVRNMLSGNAKQVCRQPSLQDSFSSDRSGSSCSSCGTLSGDGMPAKMPASPPVTLLRRVEQNSTLVEEDFVGESSYERFALDCLEQTPCYEQIPVQQKSSVARTA